MTDQDEASLMAHLDGVGVPKAEWYGAFELEKVTGLRGNSLRRVVDAEMVPDLPRVDGMHRRVPHYKLAEWFNSANKFP